MSLAVAAATAVSLLTLGTQGAGAAPSGESTEYTVVLQDGANHDAAGAAIRAAGGRITKENTAVGVLTVTAPATGFIEAVSASPAVVGAAHLRPIGHTPADAAGRPAKDAVERENTTAPNPAPARAAEASKAGADPLDGQLWGQKMIRADLAHTKQAGDKRVLVGILDTGVDGTHPDIAPNFSNELSRNFTIDIPNDPTGAVFDGPCPFRGCVDPPNYDGNGHGTHVAGTIGAAANGHGVTGVAPNVTLVNIRGGQTSGTFFLQPVIDALTYGADIGLNVINMSFFADPYYMNCTNNPADTPEQRIEQRTIIAGIERALTYAHNKGVTLIGALGNNHEDLNNPRVDIQSPDYPAGAAHPRPVDKATCIDLPNEDPLVIAVSALGPSATKSDYSSYGTDHIAVSAPGGWFRDGFGTPWYRTNENLILSSYPANVALKNGDIDATGAITPAGSANGVQKDCVGAVCGYYQFLQGTSMASPHAVGVAALIVSQYGRPSRVHSHQLALAPDAVRRVLQGTAFTRACPVPPTVSYVNVGRPAEFDATCTGTQSFNGFYGHGVVDAWAAVTRGREFLRD
ncbi:S8 family serine peptidase [Solihabitans fulvus]|uniref:S8 family serine peptidase n=1 Tax=Solihabitans fulvus TaxID=1892852 RepID=A0A5B2XEH7_9PSEU|nr:S8 family serine peptidase [Solihabitans fulvus]